MQLFVFFSKEYRPFLLKAKSRIPTGCYLEHDAFFSNVFRHLRFFKVSKLCISFKLEYAFFALSIHVE